MQSTTDGANDRKSCPHFEKLPWRNVSVGEKGEKNSLMDKIGLRLKSDPKCQQCSKPSSSNLLCLNDSCLFVGCGRHEKRHALEHYQTFHQESKTENCHCVMLDLLSFTCWCYECDDAFAPKLFSALEPLHYADKTDDHSSKKAAKNSSGTFPVGSVGLQNLGNSCYINAALQVLINCPPIVGYFRHCGAHVRRKPERRAADIFQHFIDGVCESRTQLVSPGRLIKEVKSFNPIFHGYTQQDSMDFLRCILERMHEELKIPDSVETQQQQPEASTRRKSGRLAQKFNSETNSTPKFKSIISKSFGGTLRSEIVCLNCRNVSVKEDLFFDLSVQISSEPVGTLSPTRSIVSSFFSSITESLGFNGKTVKLESCLSAFCAPELLEGRDRYWCEKCSALVASQKTLRISKAPEILCIQLKRFKHEGYFSSKIGTHVIIPTTQLDLQPFIYTKPNSVLPKDSYYDLFAIISHRGTFNGGHYVSYCKHPQTLQWIEYDDTRIRIITEEELVSLQAYIVLFELRSTAAEEEREKWALAASEVNNPKEDIVYISREWYNSWLTMSNPGPIDNSELICPHGLMLPLREGQHADLVQPLPHSVYSHLVARHGNPNEASPIRNIEICKICSEEEKRLDSRRQEEDQAILSLDTSTIDPNEHWHLISSAWLLEWSKFKSGLTDPPGPISNQALFKENGEPKPNLSRGIHYRGINKKVWNYFHGIYGGGPLIQTKTIDIYSLNQGGEEEDIDILDIETNN